MVVQETKSGERIQRDAAEDFINDFYNTVLDDPKSVWDTMLTDHLRARHDRGFADFESNWSQWSGVERERVRVKPDSQNWFIIDVAYVDQGGNVQSVRPIEFSLVCDDVFANRLPIITCNQDDLRLQDAYNLSSQLIDQNTD